MRHLALYAISALIFGSCATRESVPQVRLLGNKSGLKPEAIEFVDAYSFLNSSGPPDVPPGIHLVVGRANRFKFSGSRYLVSSNGRVRILSVENPKKYHLTENLARLRQSLSAGDPSIACTIHGEDEVPWMNAGRQFIARREIREFPWGKALLFVTKYVQGPDYGPLTNDSLTYVAQGITHDGRFAVAGQFDMRHPSLPDMTDEGISPGRLNLRQGTAEDDQKVERWLDSQSGDSFSPKIRQIYEFLEAIEIR